MLCLSFDARIRSTDGLGSANKHLLVYRPTVVIVDSSLPVGSGLALIESQTHAQPRIDVILGTSGDPPTEQRVLVAGGDSILGKPIASLPAFQAAILIHMPVDQQPPCPRQVSTDLIEPDMVVYHDDLSHLADVLEHDSSPQAVDYVSQLLSGVADSAWDNYMLDAVYRVIAQRKAYEKSDDCLQDLTSIVQNRLAAASGF